nr:MAG TPA: hypothetical protein [Caudoviricetes sp.]
MSSSTFCSSAQNFFAVRATAFPSPLPTSLGRPVTLS